jgi:N-acetylmuramoyl-L-alanine amidase
MTYRFQQSPNRSSRRGVAINAIILHFTASATLTGTVKWFQNERARVSAHYVIGRYGDVVQMVDDEEKAWHAGGETSSLKGDPRVNSMSIGIEMVNWGELKKRDDKFYVWPKKYTRPYDAEKYGQPIFAENRWWAPYTEEQFQACLKLCRELMDRHPDITVERILGHEDVDPTRKTDPGPAFDIKRLRMELSVVPDHMYIDYEDEISEEELIARQADRAEPGPMSWIDRLWALWQARGGTSST